MNSEHAKKALVIIQTNVHIGGNHSTVWLLPGKDLLPQEFELDPDTIRISGPISSNDAEMIGSQLTLALQRLGIESDKTYTIDD